MSTHKNVSGNSKYKIGLTGIKERNIDTDSLGMTFFKVAKNTLYDYN